MNTLTRNQRIIKRVFDILVVICLIPVLIPMMGIIAVLIGMDSRGAVIFRQKRVGEGGVIFWMYKFRTMVCDAQAHEEFMDIQKKNGRIIQIKDPNDPRLTRIGKYLRRSSLDELPQVINVLRGEMSLVGPRPELVEIVEQYEPWQRKRLMVPQGITGWWQINGRSDKPMYLHTEDDLFYIEHYSFWLDLAILLRTIRAVFTREGAY